jgi:hypothetical protein
VLVKDRLITSFVLTLKLTFHQLWMPRLAGDDSSGSSTQQTCFLDAAK